MIYKLGFKSLGLFFSMTLIILFLSTPIAKAENNDSFLDIGSNVNNKMRYLSTEFDPENETQTSLLKAIRMADSLPDDFVPSEENTVSIVDSTCPVYIFFDNNNDAGVMYFYTKGDRIVVHPNSAFMFCSFPNLTDISGVEGWDTSQVITMYGMFAQLYSLPDALALRTWDTSSVTNMEFMFAEDYSLMYIDVSNWDTENVTKMGNMFQVGSNYAGNGQLTEILGLGNWDVSNVIDMTCMFYGAGKMTYYDVADWNVSKVESMNHMFCDNFKLKSLDLSRWDMSSVKTIYSMFDDAQSLITIGDVSHWNTSSLIDAGGWLNYATSFVGNELGCLDLSGWDTGNLKSVGEMFLKTKISKVDLSGWTFDSVTDDSWEGAGKGIYYEYGNGYGAAVKGFGQMFKDTPKLTAVYVSESGLESFNAAIEREVNIEDMWTNSMCTGFTIK